MHVAFRHDMLWLGDIWRRYLLTTQHVVAVAYCYIFCISFVSVYIKYVPGIDTFKIFSFVLYRGNDDCSRYYVCIMAIFADVF